MSRSLFYIIARNPVTFLFLILINTLLICIIMWWTIKVSWISFILFLIFLGGLIVIFIYITSLASIDRTYFMRLIRWKNLITLVVIFMRIILLNPTHSETIFNIIKLNNIINPIFSSSIIRLTALTIAYLLFTLIVVVRIINKFNAPIKTFHLI